MVRSVWNGEIRVLRNFEQPLFPTGRQGLLECVNPAFDHHNRLLGWQREEELGEAIEKAGLKGDEWRRQVAKEAARWLLFEEIGGLVAPENYEWVLLMDADCVVLRNLDHLFDRDVDVLVTELGEPDPGFVGVRGWLIKDLLTEWQSARALRKNWDGGHWQDLRMAIGRRRWRVGSFERGEVLRASSAGAGLADLKDAAVVHFGGLDPKDKQRLAFGFHLMTVYGDEDGLFLDMLES